MNLSGRLSKMRFKICLVAVLLVAASMTPAGAQSVKHIQSKDPGGIATGVWVGDVFYLDQLIVQVIEHQPFTVPRRRRRKTCSPRYKTC